MIFVSYKYRIKIDSLALGWARDEKEVPMYRFVMGSYTSQAYPTYGEAVEALKSFVAAFPYGVPASVTKIERV